MIERHSLSQSINTTDGVEEEALEAVVVLDEGTTSTVLEELKER